jgi:hypothetical protein
MEVALESRHIDNGRPLEPMTLEIYESALDELPIQKSKGVLSSFSRCTYLSMLTTVTDVKDFMTEIANLDQIPVESLEIFKGKDRRHWHSVGFNLEVTIGDGGLLKFTVKHGQDSYGERSVTAKFR